MKCSLRKQIVYPYAREKVWVALTDPRAIAEWLMPNDFAPVVGHRFRFQTDPSGPCGGLSECEVLEVEAPNRLVYSWKLHPREGKREYPSSTVVAWTLEEVEGGTRLTLEQTGYVGARMWMIRNIMLLGWSSMLKRGFRRVLDNIDDKNEFTPGAVPLEKRFYKVKTVPDDLVY